MLYIFNFNNVGCHPRGLPFLLDQKREQKNQAYGFLNAQNLLISLKPVNSLSLRHNWFFNGK